VLTRGFSCLNALNALFAKLVDIVGTLWDGEVKGKMKYLQGPTLTQDKDYSTATVLVVQSLGSHADQPECRPVAMNGGDSQTKCYIRSTVFNTRPQAQRFLSAFHLYTRGL
jgi:hypothetical protein